MSVADEKKERKARSTLYTNLPSSIAPRDEGCDERGETVETPSRPYTKTKQEKQAIEYEKSRGSPRIKGEKEKREVCVCKWSWLRACTCGEGRCNLIHAEQRNLNCIC